MKSIRNILITLLLLTFGMAAAGQITEKKSLTLDGAKKVIAAAVAEARRLNAPGGVIAVVDNGGNLIALERLDGTFAAGANISIGKARTAVLFQRPTAVFEKIIRDGRTPMIALPDEFFTPLQGGVPIVVGDQVVGGIGVSGAASAQQDEELALAGAEAAKSFAAATNGAANDDVFYLKNDKVAAAFVKGQPLIEVGDYKVHASHRNAAGQAEVHAWETDVIYVLDGSATFVTGGAVVEGQTTAPGEIRGKSIEGGETRKITKGDVIIVPQGVPHWFKEVNGKIDYYVVKVIG